ncbi:FtsJ-like methyltransferase-domain-containing protein [Chaetomium fimeti]|uniref:rRNA methyltransferase 2, mitochondrial n=1 Tax=Chaetomium fimeti TaxID=1854472 RepID=A0AAE0HG45_9PEZI|nr:FtsJ-like methyltransferase-domain-containing protein [Chaetomium fimeti]
MQAPWTRTPLRVAVPVARGLSCSSSRTNTFNSHYFLPSTYTAASKPTISSPCPNHIQSRPASSSGSWKIRQGNDYFARNARVSGYKSRAAFKLLELDSKYEFFRRGEGQVVVDLGYAPGSWSQVAVDRTAPNGTILGIDIIPAQPPKGVSTIQGNFLSPGVQRMVKQVLVEGDKRRRAEREERREEVVDEDADAIADRPSYIDFERMAAHESDSESGSPASPSSTSPSPGESTQPKEQEKPNLRLVDVVLSDMSEAWPQTRGFSVRALSNAYNRMMNTSGTPFRDHAGSMDLCHAALTFASETLKPGGDFVCKFYQGAEDKAFETLLKGMFERVHREKPEASRGESRESFFVALRRNGDVTLQDIERR